MLNRCTILLAALTLLGCEDDSKDTEDTDDSGDTDSGTTDTGDTGTTGEIVALTIDNHMAVCSAEGQWLCPLVKFDGEGDWATLDCGVSGLDYVWGTTYTLTAQKVGYSDPAGDGCGDVYDLVEVQSSTFDGAGRAFTYQWVYDSQIEADGAGGGSLMGAAFVCADASVCKVAEAAGSTWQHTYTIALENPAKAGDPLLMTALAVEK